MPTSPANPPELPPLPYTSTGYDATAIVELGNEWLPAGTKGAPLMGDGSTLAAFSASGLRVLDGSIPMPLLLLREQRLKSNIDTMADFCEDNDVLFAPHGKTTMAPQIFARQIDAGAWAMTAATPSHLRVYRRFGVQRILLANQLPEAGAVRWLCEELRRDDDFEFLCLVDSVAGIRLLEEQLARFEAPREVRVLLEVGYRGGRAGVRDMAEAREVGAAAVAARHLQLIGVECFEGLIDGGGIEPTIAMVDQELERLAQVVEGLLEVGILPPSPILSAGGSAYFDRVLAKLRPLPGRLVLRSGCYVTQDGGFYEATSPLAARNGQDPVLYNALELCSTILSRPEPGLAIASFGRRDAPYDMGMPIPTHARLGDAAVTPFEGAEVVELNDQHAHVRVPDHLDLGIGDLLRCSVSHPCGAFDRWRVIPIVDGEDVIVDAVLTFFQ